MNTDPILTTDRLVLREILPSDADSMFELNSDPEVLKYTGDDPFESVAATREFLENYSDYQRNGFGRWAVILKETGELLGWCGLKRDRDTNEVDIGYRFLQKHWNKGYATESAIACMRFGAEQLKLERIIGRARTENIASIRVFDKLGMTWVSNFEEDGESWVLYAINY